MPWLKVPSFRASHASRKWLGTDSANSLEGLTPAKGEPPSSDNGSGPLHHSQSAELRRPDEQACSQPTPSRDLRSHSSNADCPALVRSSCTAPSLRRTDITQPLAGHQYYRWLADVNRGTSGFVQRALDLRTGQEVAIKFILRGPSAPSFDAQHITQELLNHRMVGRHPNIVQLLEVFPTEHHLAIVMEYASGGDLSELIDSRGQQDLDGIPETDAAWFMQQLVCAVEFCHRLGVANRDIKLDNMLLHGRGRRPMLRICDFGYSKDELGQSVSKSTCGTPEYMAPEVLFEDRYNGQAADVWSCGVSLFVLLTGEFPFARSSDVDMPNVVRMQRMFGRIVKGDIAPMPQLSPACRDLLGLMLKPVPADRISLQEVAEHPWLSIAQPQLPPLVVNDRLAQAMERFAATDQGACRQSVADIVDMVAACAEARVHPGRRLLPRRPRSRLRTQSQEVLAMHRSSPTPRLPPQDRFRSPSEGAQGLGYSGRTSPAAMAPQPSAFEQGWAEGACQSAEFRAAPQLRPPPPSQQAPLQQEADYAGMLIRAGLGGWGRPQPPPPSLPRLPLPPLGDCPSAELPQGMELDACPPWGGQPQRQSHSQAPQQRQASWQQLPSCASAGAVQLAAAGAFEDTSSFVSMTL